MKLGKILCFVGMHRYTHVVEEWDYTVRMEYCALGVQSFHKICKCGHRAKVEGYNYIGLPEVAAPVYSYLNR